ncbi:MAG: pyridoxamine 5'-phosphate oxidase family protein [Candidatus Omnitrophota bacterium]
MTELKDEIIHFFQNQGYVLVSTIDRDGGIHASCKGIVTIDASGRVYLLDLYKGVTFENLKRCPNISVSAVDEHRFKGFCLKGRAHIVNVEQIDPQVVSSWEEKINSRLSKRIVKNIQGEKGHQKHPEVLLPKPEYMVVMDVITVIDLTPHHLRETVHKKTA